ncbi:MAG: trypsin-like peptidase domain-containing protein [Planctomycetota bacterium]|nr:trypsin-like peptidase domain-containing protein [Planctomycetota bacterium]RLS23791.1 MAG: peptidase S1 [Planctomycetota bacterium]
MKFLTYLIAFELLAGIALADDRYSIDLRGGGRVVGTLLTEKPDALFVDLGHDVVRLPKDQILKRHKLDQAESPSTAGAVTTTEDDMGGFYKTGGLDGKSVRQLVDQFGEGVISIDTPSGKGSGFLLNSDGYAITNQHVIAGETRISATLYKKNATGALQRVRVEEIEIVAMNPLMDLALIRLPKREELIYKPCSLAVDELAAGDGVYAIGNPLGLERSVSQGIVSTRNRNFEGLVYLQTDAAINPGNSGGPLFNLKGEVVGVTNMKATSGDNLGFAIPIRYVKDFLRNRDAFGYDKTNPNAGYRYMDAPRRVKPRVASNKPLEAPPKL